MKNIKSFKDFKKTNEDYNIDKEDYNIGTLKYNPGDIVYVFQYYSKKDEIDKKYVVGKGNSTQKWSKCEIIKRISDEEGWERYIVKQLDGYRDEKEFIAHQNQMSLTNDTPISIGYM